jgi:hypothetical protein
MENSIRINDPEQRFKPRTSQIRSRGANHSTTTFGSSALSLSLNRIITFEHILLALSEHRPDNLCDRSHRRVTGHTVLNKKMTAAGHVGGGAQHPAVPGDAQGMTGGLSV